MFNSKPLKDLPERSKLYLWWIETPFCDFFDDLRILIVRPYRLLSRLYDWHKNVFSKDHDWDSYTLLPIMRYKLERIEFAMENGNSIYENKEIKSIRVAIKLLKRLEEDKYGHHSYEKIEAKWGKLVTWTTPAEDHPGCSFWHSKYEKVVTPEDEDECKKDREKFYTLELDRQTRDERVLYAILLKYRRFWWD